MEKDSSNVFKTFNEAKNRGYDCNYTNVNYNKSEKTIFDKITDGVSIVGAAAILAGVAYGTYKIYNNIYVPLRKQHNESRVKNCTPDGERVMNGTIVKSKFFSKNYSLVEDAKEAIERNEVCDVDVQHISDSNNQHW